MVTQPFSAHKHVLGSHHHPKQQYLPFTRGFPQVFPNRTHAPGRAAHLYCDGGLALTSMLPNPLAAMEEIACGLPAVLQWDTAAAHAAPCKVRETPPLGSRSGKEWDEMIFIAVGMGMHSQFCFLVLIQSNMLSVGTKIAVFTIETLGLVTRYIL